MMIIKKIKSYFSFKEMINDSYSNSGGHFLTDKEVVELQNALVEILKDLNNACEKYQIRPFLQGGSLLGKLRHNGFIPWDDDLDLGMSRDDYEKFKMIFDKELGDKYLLKGPGVKDGATNRFIQMFKKDSYYETVVDSIDFPKKIYVDIFPIDFVPENKFSRLIKGNVCNIEMIIASCVEYKKSKALGDNLSTISKRNNINDKVRTLIGSIFSYRDLNNWYKKVDMSIRNKKETSFATSATGRKHYFGEIVPSNVFFPLKESEFCGVKTWIPNNSKHYLINLYGNDYMEIPPESKREHHYVIKIRL